MYLWCRSLSRHRSLDRTVSSAVASPAMGHVPPPLDFKIRETTIQVLCSLRDQLLQMSTTRTLSISTALVTKLLVIEQLLQPALKFTVSAP